MPVRGSLSRSSTVPQPGRPAAVRPAPGQGVTWRSVLLALILLPPACWWLEYTECVSEGTDMAGISYVLPALFLLFVLVCLNQPVRRRWPGRALSQGELLTVFAMLSAGLTLGGPGGMQHLVMAAGNVHWFAGPGNGWGRFDPLLPHWLFPAQEVLRDFYRGEAPRVPWSAWLAPILAWGVFILVLVFVMLCLAALLRRQWTEHERLSYPLVHLPIELSRQEGGLFGAFSPGRSGLRLFWSAVLLTLAVESLDSLAYLYPSLPSIPIKPIELQAYFPDRPWSAIGYFCVAFYPLVLGIGYLLSLEVLFSCWFFYLLTRGELIACSAWGWSEGGRQLPYLEQQGAGAWIALALAAFWMARRQLGVAVRRAWSGKGEEDREPLPARWALLGAGGGVLFLALLCRAIGMSFVIAVAVLLLYLLYAVAAARIRSEAGTAWLFSPGANAPAVLVAGLGPERLGLSNLVGFACLQWFMISCESVALPYHLEGFRMGDAARLSRPAMFRALLLASAVGIAAAFWALISLYYHYGAGTAKVNEWRTQMGSVPWERLNSWTQGPQGINLPALEATGVGSLVVAGLTALRLRFLWWPLHPIGYALANTWTMAWLWFPCLLMWLVKSLILRYGGLRLYRQWLPFFLGLIMGDYLAGGLWAILGAVLDIKIYRIFVI